MRRIIKCLLEAGILEEDIHKVLDLIEEEYDIVNEVSKEMRYRAAINSLPGRTAETLKDQGLEKNIRARHRYEQALNLVNTYGHGGTVIYNDDESTKVSPSQVTHRSMKVHHCNRNTYKKGFDEDGTPSFFNDGDTVDWNSHIEDKEAAAKKRREGK